MERDAMKEENTTTTPTLCETAKSGGARCACMERLFAAQEQEDSAVAVWEEEVEIPPAAVVEPEDEDEADPCDHHPFEEEEGAVAGAVAEEPAAAPCACKGLLKYRKLHSLCGVMIGLFALGHLMVLATGLSPAAYVENCQALDVLVKNFRIFEIAFVLIPLILLLSSGLYLLGRSGLSYNIKRCKRGGKMRHFIQRMTALCILLFLLFHVATFSTWGVHSFVSATGITGWDRYEKTSLYNTAQPYESTVDGVRHFWTTSMPLHPMNLMVAGFYLVGTLALAYHFANGIWSGAVAWEFCKVSQARRYLSWPCLGLGVGLALLGALAWLAFTVFSK
jgi:succinate dehydrogenase / fumarate reductase cytochrome b subunit